MSLLILQPRNRPVIDWSFLGSALPESVTFNRACTATMFGNDGVMNVCGANQPRFDYDPVTREPLGLLMEEQRQNLIADSNVFAISSSVVITPASGTGLTGVNDLVKIADNTTVASHLATSAAGSVSFTSGTVYTYAVYAKAGTETIVQLGYSTSAFATTAYANFDLSSGTVTYSGAGLSSPASIVAIGDGVFRISISSVATATTAGSGGVIALTNTNPAMARFASYMGVGKYIYVQRAQTEAGAFASSYIPTYGAVTTRAADLLAFTIPANVTRLRAIFDGIFYQDVAVSAGGYTLPTNLNRRHVKRIQLCKV